jgi:hypothetical protein
MEIAEKLERDFYSDEAEKIPAFPYELLEIPDSDTPPWKRFGLTDGQENDGFKGGRYGDLKDAGYGWPYLEVHHIPAKSVSELSIQDGPAIVMEREHHGKTASYGLSREACEYRAAQKELIEQRKFREAVQMDIDDIHEKFGDKYDDAIEEMLEYIDKLLRSEPMLADHWPLTTSTSRREGDV